MLPLSRAIGLLILTLLFSGTAFAQKDYTFSPTGPIEMLADSGEERTQIIAITNETNSRTFMKIRFFGDEDFTFSHSHDQHFWVGADSTAHVSVTYHATRGDTSYGWLRMYDSVNTADTIAFMGMDTGTTYSGPVWRIVEDSSFNAGDIYSRPDSAVVYVRNYSGSSVSVTSSLLLGSYGFTAVGSQQRTIAAGSATRFYYRFDPKYALAVGSVRISGAGISDTITIQGRSSTAPPQEDTLTFDYIDQWFGPIAPGDSAFRTATIYNWTDSAVTISELAFSEDMGTLSLVDAPSLPYTIPTHDSLVVLMRFLAPTTPNTSIEAWLYLISSPPSRWQAMRIHASSSGCVSTDPDFLSFGVVPIDSVATRSVTVTNHTNSPIVIDSLYLRSLRPHSFSLNTQAPLTIAANGDTSISISFDASGGGEDTIALVFTTSGCDVRIMGVTAAVDSLFITDTTTFELIGDSTQMLYFSGDSSFATQVYSFVNDLTDSLNILSVSLKQGTYFQVFDIDPVYPQFTMAPQDIMDVTLQFIGSPGTYEDTLVIVAENTMIPLLFPIQAVIQGSDVRSPLATSARLRVSPNPSTGPVTIQLDNAQRASIDVLDVMGKLVSRLDANAVWDRSDVASGTYFMRASGIDDLGKPFVITQRVVIE